MATNLLNREIPKLILAIFIIELISLISFKSAILSATFFILISIAVLLFTLYKLEYGLYIALIELMIGSYGYLFYVQLPGFKAPIRLAIFLIVFFVWLFKYVRLHDFFNLLKKDSLAQNFILLIAFLGVGFINGLLHHNDLANTFFDFNGYLYFGLFFVFLEVFKNEKQIINFLKILFASVTYVSLKVIITLYFFSHGFLNTSDLLYHWIRDTRVGEITFAGANFFRIFFQSQIWSLIGIFIILVLIIAIFLSQKKPLCHPEQSEGSITTKSPRFLTSFGMTERFFLLLIIVQTSILISFSRTFWLAEIVGLIVLLVYLIIIKLNIKKLAQIFLIIFSSGIISILLLFSIANFPIPKPTSELAISLLKNRFTAFFGEAGVSSRWNQLPVLTEQIKKAPILGKGFGTSLTYQSNDPRIKNESNPEGWYTTYTFEWGYLDTITEIGILGLLVYLFLIGQIFYLGLKSLVIQESKWLNLGFLLGLVVLIVVNMFSPYLNHPLGIGYLMLCTAIFKIKKDR
ncbi:MAG: O-antigen ligase family protein [Candidatus Parcubacteria bacterium]|nr:O-antigen ligase family protein [Candidatus Parcubacteria bacterium]